MSFAASKTTKIAQKQSPKGTASRALPEKDAADRKPWLPARWDYETDVLVIGYGGAGACAAITARDAGAKVLILEKAPVSGGNTATAAGIMKIPGDVPNAITYYRALTCGTVDEESLPGLAKAMVELPHRLEKWGAKLKYVRAEADYPVLPGSAGVNQRVFFSRTASDTGDVMEGAGDRLFSFLSNQVEKRDISVIYNTPAMELIQDPITKAILGVKAERSGGIHVRARRGVVLACGGFENNREMLVNFLPYMTQLPVYPMGTPYNTGDGILMAARVGAKLWHMAGVELGNFAPKAPGEKFGVGFRLLRRLPVGSQVIYVDKYGKRFMNESLLLSHRKELFEVQYFNHTQAGYPHIPFYMVFDDTFRKKGPIVDTHYSWWCIHKLYKWSRDNSAEIKRGWIIKGNTIKDLAKKIGVDSDALEETVGTYNEYCRTDDDAQFGRPGKWLAPIESPPYYATELCEPIINTQGGPKHDSLTRVLDKEDKPIQGLYAAGELGSFFFPLYEGGSNIPEALAFGIIAGEQAAGQPPWE